jgi:methyl-accepting chemotaxis protein
MRGLLNRMSIGQRLAAGFAVVLLLLVAMASGSLLMFERFNAKVSQMADVDAAKLEAALTMQVYVRANSRRIMEMAIAGDAAQREHVTVRMASNQKNSDKARAQLQKLVEGKGDRALLGKVLDSEKVMIASFGKVSDLANEGKAKEAVALVNGETTKRINDVTAALESLTASQRKAMNQAVTDSHDLYHVARNNVLAMGAGALLLAGLIAWLLTRSITRPVRSALEHAKAIAAGDLGARIESVGRDEPALLLQEMARMQAQIGGVIGAQVEMAAKHREGLVSHRIEAGRFPGAYGDLAAKVNELVEQHIEVSRQTVAVVGEYARGNLAPDMARLLGEQAVITEAMDGVKMHLLAINGEIKRLVDAAAAGDFGVRGDEAAHSHTFGEMVAGLNRLMETCGAGLDEVSRVMGRIAQGDLSARMEGTYQGAFERIKLDTNATAEQLGVIVGDIRQATETINTAAREISAGNADLSQRTEEQASSLEETAASMEELTVTVKQNTESARQANQLAVSASEIAARGGERVTEVVSTMDAISSSSKKIADIIGVIDGIAFQTNILALNAAVEAARAGEQGRGFAVVATEVRNLAQRSAEAAREIKGLIGDSVQKVEAGAKLVADAGATMDEIVGAVKRVTGIMGEITAASVEQSAGIEQVSQAVAQMDKVTQQNAALVEQAAAAAESMEGQAGGLSKTVAVFRLAGGASASSGLPAPVRNALPAPKREVKPHAASGNKPVNASADEWEEF